MTTMLFKVSSGRSRRVAPIDKEEVEDEDKEMAKKVDVGLGSGVVQNHRQARRRCV